MQRNPSLTHRPAPERRAVFSICAPNYLARAAALMDSAARHLPDHDRVLVLAAETLATGDARVFPEGTRLLTPDAIDVPDLDVRRRLYNVTEFCTAIKPDVVRRLWAEGYDAVLYFDPDIVLFDRPDEIEAAWAAGAEIALTPHLVTTSPHPDWVMRAVSLSGQFNLGFLAVRDAPEARRLVDWWRERIAWRCIEDAGNGTFVDQKVVDHFPALSGAVHVIRHPGYNVAYWNIHERDLERRGDGWLASGQPLAFFHYSGFEMFGAGISRHVGLPQARGGAVDAILRQYGRDLVAHGDLGHALRPYRYDRLPGGARPSALLRRALHRALADRAMEPLDILRPGWLWEPVAAGPLAYGGAIPRILHLLRRFADLPADVEGPFATYLDAGRRERRAALLPLLSALHTVGAIDVTAAEELTHHPSAIPPPVSRPAVLTWPVPMPIAGPGTLPALPLLLHGARTDLGDSFDLSTVDGLVGYIAWFLSIGLGGWTATPATIAGVAEALDDVQLPSGALRDMPAGSLLETALVRLLVPAEDRRSAAIAGSAILMALLDGAKPGPIRRALAQVLRAWLWRPGDGGAPARVFRLLAATPALRDRLLGPSARRVTLAAVDAALTRVGLGELARGSPPLPPTTPEANDAVVVGPFATTSGVGHSAHGIVAALRASGQSPDTVDLLRPAVEAADRAPALLLLHANADVTLDAVVKFENLWRAAGRRVGYWYWELGAMTRRMAAAAMLLDEIWVATEFVRNAVAPVVRCPVRVCPPILEADDFAPSTADGGSFGVGKQRYRFLGVLDARSFISRKNPEGIVRAFRSAFPDGNEPVELLVKLSNAHHNADGLALFRDLADGDRRIRLLDGSFSAAEMNDLYQSSDCFVSLHRSEGLALGIAQAMMLGKPVIATGYSGPMDFMSPATAFLVPFRLVPVQRDAYPDWLGQEWAEPDERAAAVYMKELAAQAEAGRAVGRRAAVATRRHFSAQRIVPIIRDLLPPGPAPART